MKANKKCFFINFLSIISIFIFIFFPFFIFAQTDPADTSTAVDDTATVPTTTVTTPTKTDTQSDVSTILYSLEAPLGDTYYVTNLNEYIVLIYKFSVSAAAILATIVIMFGGLSWAASAGNEQRITSAKETIIGAIVGLILAVGSYLILTTINPSLSSLAALNILKIPMTAFTFSSTSSSSSSGTSSPKCVWSYTPVSGKIEADYEDFCKDTTRLPDINDSVSGNVTSPKCYCPSQCKASTNDHCSMTFLRAHGGACFGSDSDLAKASAICQGESNGVTTVPSGCDICAGNKKRVAFSYGLFQINLIAHGAKLNNFDGVCSWEKVFAKNGDGRTQGTYTAGVGYDCWVINDTLFNTCVGRVTVGDAGVNENIRVACLLKADPKKGWTHWGWNNTNCGWFK